MKERPGTKRRKSELTEETNKVTSTVMHAGSKVQYLARYVQCFRIQQEQASGSDRTLQHQNLRLYRN